VKRPKTKDRSTGPLPLPRDTPQIGSPSADDDEHAVAAALEPLKRALLKLRERCPAICSAAALASSIKQLDPVEETCATHMTPARQAEFTGGRLAAKQALRDAGLGAPVVVADEQGVPIFPAGYVGSIAHKHGRAVAIAAKTAVAHSIGIDLEFDENHDEESLVAEIITEVEQPRLATICAAEPTLLSPATLVLAAKEAVYKAVFQITRTTFDFDDAEVLFATDSRSFRAVRFPGDEHLMVQGEYELVGRWIVAIAIAFATR
jgi:4'-phosphopantetheinyl transferase EntD